MAKKFLQSQMFVWCQDIHIKSCGSHSHITDGERKGGADSSLILNGCISFNPRNQTRKEFHPHARLLFAILQGFAIMTIMYRRQGHASRSLARLNHTQNKSEIRIALYLVKFWSDQNHCKSIKILLLDCVEIRHSLSWVCQFFGPRTLSFPSRSSISFHSQILV